MIIGSEQDVTAAVLAELARAEDPRFREIMSAAVRQLREPITGKAEGERPQLGVLPRRD